MRTCRRWSLRRTPKTTLPNPLEMGLGAYAWNVPTSGATVASSAS